MIADLVDEELLAREAREMGLDENDTIVRRRLAQKLEYMVDDTAHLVDPPDDQLRQFYEAHGDRFLAGTTLTFMQVYFSSQKRKDAEGDAKTALAALQGPGGDALAQTLGDPLLMEADFRNADEQMVSSIFGPDFAKALFGMKPGGWVGPIKSSYGYHLVEISSATAADRPPFDQVRDKVLAEWRREQEDEAKQLYLAQLRQKYPIVLDDSVKALLGEKLAAEATRP